VTRFLTEYYDHLDKDVSLVTGPVDLINVPIYWASTKRGKDFWSDLNDFWVRTCKLNGWIDE